MTKKSAPRQNPAESGVLILEWHVAIRAEICWKRKLIPADPRDAPYVVAESPFEHAWMDIWCMMQEQAHADTDLTKILEAVVESGYLSKSTSEMQYANGIVQIVTSKEYFETGERSCDDTGWLPAEDWRACIFIRNNKNMKMYFSPPLHAGVLAEEGTEFDLYPLSLIGKKLIDENADWLAETSGFFQKTSLRSFLAELFSLGQRLALKKS